MVRDLGNTEVLDQRSGARWAESAGKKHAPSEDGLASFIDTTKIEQGTRAVVMGKSAEVD